MNIFFRAPVLLQSTLGAIPDPSVAKVIMTVNMFLELANEKLQYLKGIVIKNSIKMNADVHIHVHHQIYSRNKLRTY